MNDEKKDAHNAQIEGSFVIYDPDHLAYQKLCLCTYLLELPQNELPRGAIKPEDIERYEEK